MRLESVIPSRSYCNRGVSVGLSGVRLPGMASESANGSDPAKGRRPDPTEDEGLTPFERFERLTREIVAVPKAEVDKRREKATRPRRRNRQPAKP